ncbi:DUF6268 family outer membrane beta-barrel protein [Opitutus sp. ER46]|uniref:DUF6268 family outer membrane beta-barrel protein n=1 Tax=Opitutus sp. ER46 TaxID=2161864 RepID=UPI000D326DE5|nr:DUF6268 family outer membrane beta-barrel protein [Opitutus sp. ER46]PTX96516.1 hypothetical protein DB354_07620 [Opitutus sp. ER46]
MFTTLRFPAILALVLLPVTIIAQPGRSGAGLPSSVTVTAGGASADDLNDDFGGRFGDTQVTHVAASLSHRFSLTDRSSLTLEGGYERFDLDSDPAVVPLPDQLQTVSVQGMLRHPLGPRWSLLANLKTSVANSGTGIESDGLGVNVVLLGLYRQTDTFSWAAGLMYRSLAEDDYRWLPAVGFDWRPNQTWAVSVGFPRTGVTYTLNDRVRTSLEATFQGGTFYVKEPVGVRLAGPRFPLRDTLLDYSEVRVGGTVEYQPHPAVTLTASTGVVVGQKFDYFDRNYELSSDGATPFVRLAVRYSF